MSIDAVEVTQLRDHAAGGIEHYDLVGLIRDYPDVVGIVDQESIGAADAVNEYFRRVRLTPGHPYPHHGILARIRHEQRGLRLVEGQPISAKWRYAVRAEQRIDYPCHWVSTGRRCAPDRRLKRV